MPHLYPMFEPVSALSPVIITTPIFASFNYVIAPLVCGFNLFSNTSKPLNASPDYADSLLIDLKSFPWIFLLAIASTLKPLDVYYFRISL